MPGFFWRGPVLLASPLPQRLKLCFQVAGDEWPRDHIWGDIPLRGTWEGRVYGKRGEEPTPTGRRGGFHSQQEDESEREGEASVPAKWTGRLSALRSGLERRPRRAEVRVVTCMLSGLWCWEGANSDHRQEQTSALNFRAGRRRSGCSGGSDLPVAGGVQTEAVEIFRILGCLTLLTSPSLPFPLPLCLLRFQTLALRLFSA